MFVWKVFNIITFLARSSSERHDERQLHGLHVQVQGARQSRDQWRPGTVAVLAPQEMSQS